MMFQMTFSGHTMAASLFDNAAARKLLGMRPADLEIEDYSTNKKIAYVLSKLTKPKDVLFGNKRPSDIAYYAPWGNLLFFYDAYRYLRGLIRLGRFEQGLEPLLTRGAFPLRIKAV